MKKNTTGFTIIPKLFALLATVSVLGFGQRSNAVDSQTLARRDKIIKAIDTAHAYVNDMIRGAQSPETAADEKPYAAGSVKKFTIGGKAPDQPATTLIVLDTTRQQLLSEAKPVPALLKQLKDLLMTDAANTPEEEEVRNILDYGANLEDYRRRPPSVHTSTSLIAPRWLGIKAQRAIEKISKPSAPNFIELAADIKNLAEKDQRFSNLKDKLVLDDLIISYKQWWEKNKGQRVTENRQLRWPNFLEWFNNVQRAYIGRGIISARIPLEDQKITEALKDAVWSHL